MGILTIEWGGLHTNALSSQNPLETELTPSSTWLTPYTPVAGWAVTAAADNTAAYMAVTWQPRRGTTPLPYLPGDLAVAAGENDPEPQPPTETTTTETTPAATTPAPAPVASTPAQSPGQVKPPPAPTVTVVSRLLGRTFTARGLVVKLVLPQSARVRAVLVRTDRTTKRGKRVTVRQQLSWTSAQKLAAGRNSLRLKPSAAGVRRLRGRTAPLSATLEVEVTYADHTSRTVRVPVVITPPAAKQTTKGSA